MRDEELEILTKRLKEIKQMGWVRNQRPNNDGGVGNTLEDLLGVNENNLKLPDFGKWEIKSQQSNVPLLTLFQNEPEPRSARIINGVLLPRYGWPHREAGTKYPENERSFRQTLNATTYTDRGFKVCVDRDARRIFIDFNFTFIDNKHNEWRSAVEKAAGTGPLRPIPFWTFDNIENEIHTKLENLIYVKANSEKDGDSRLYLYSQIDAYINPSIERFIDLMEQGLIYIDFDARTGHNHGTKFRIKPAEKTKLYETHISI